MSIETQSVTEISGTFTIPASTDLFILSAIALIVSKKTGSISPYPQSPIITQFCDNCKAVATFEYVDSVCIVRPIEIEKREIVLTDPHCAYADILLLMCLGAGMSITSYLLSAPKQSYFASIADALLCKCSFTSLENATQSVLESSEQFAFPKEDMTLETISPALALAFGLGARITTEIDYAYVTPLRYLFESLNCGFTVKSLNKHEPDDPLERRIRLMQKRKKITEGLSFCLSADFSISQSQMAPPSITLPGDEALFSLLICAKSLIQKGNVVINNAPLEPCLTQTLEFIRKMGSRPALQETHTTSFGSCGMAQIQSFVLIGKKTSVTPLLLYKSHIPAMVVIAAFSAGQSVFRDATLLRTETPDYIKSLIECLSAVTTHHGEMPDGLILEGSRQYDGFDIGTDYGALINAAFALGGMKCLGKTRCNDTSIAQRFPDFFNTLFALCEYRNAKNQQQNLL